MCCYDCGSTFPSRSKKELLVSAWNKRVGTPTIKLKKALPTEDGRYYWCEDKDHYPTIGFVEGDKFCCEVCSSTPLDELGGYWAKVEESHFEVVVE